MLYVIRHWDEHFENARTQRIKGGLPRVMVPTRLQKDGYIELVGGHEDGAAHLGVWVACLQVAANCRPRGELRRDSGQPHNLASLSAITRIPEETLKQGIQRLCDEPIRWMDRIGSQSGPDAVPTGTSEGKGREGKKREDISAHSGECAATGRDGKKAEEDRLRIARFVSLWNKAATCRNVRRMTKQPPANKSRGRRILAFVKACEDRVDLVAASMDAALDQEWLAERSEPMTVDWFVRPSHEEKHVEMGLERLNGSAK